MIDDLLRDLHSATARVRFSSAKALCQLSGDDPAQVYPRFDEIATMLRWDNQILRWNAIRTLANLAPVDTAGKLVRILPRYFAPLAGPELVTAANVIGSIPRIVAAQPRLADRLAARLMKVKSACFPTAECMNVALRHAIRAMDQIYDHVKRKKAVLAFVREQLENPRKSTREAAAAFLRHHQSALA